jgi:hypothetical protein
LGENPEIFEKPWLHRQAILMGLEAEKSSTLLEDIVKATLL